MKTYINYSAMTPQEQHAFNSKGVVDEKYILTEQMFESKLAKAVAEQQNIELEGV